jgi:hypothetical protein
MNLKQVHIKKREVVGKLRGRDVYHVETHGGLSIICCHQNGQLITVGAGPMRSVAQFIAEKKEPEIRWSEAMLKSDADKELVCPLCRQLDIVAECLCVYRDGYVLANPPKIE